MTPLLLKFRDQISNVTLDVSVNFVLTLRQRWNN